MTSVAKKNEACFSEKNTAIEAGIVLINKPTGPSSFRVVQDVRRAMSVKKVGHSGTLDPFASGLLIICIGRLATKIIPLLMKEEKEYQATLRLGVETETQDPEGKITVRRPVPALDFEKIDLCLNDFIGQQDQTPPQYSALKHKGKPLYYYARRGIKVIKEPRRIEIKTLERLKLNDDTLTIRVVCSKGTYIRTLAADIGKALGCGAHLTSLRRTRIGPFRVTESLPAQKLLNNNQAKELLTRYIMTVDQITDQLN